MKSYAGLLFFLLVVGGFINSLFYHPDNPFEIMKKLEQADQSYRDGEMATSLQVREKSFNEALSIYQELGQSSNPSHGNGKLYYNIGNSYFQLGQVPLAILYYYRALALSPRDEKIMSNLDVARDKLSLPKIKRDSSLFDIFSFHKKLSLPERFQLLFALSVVMAIVGSLAIRRESVVMLKVAKVLGFMSLLVMLSLIYTQYFSPIEAVVMEATPLRRDAGMHYAKVVDLPVLAGSQVEVIDVVRGKGWLKVMTTDGELGFVPSKSVKIVR